MHGLYPPIHPFSEGFLPIREGHSLYLEQSGNPDGLPVVILHDSPGNGGNPDFRRLLSPEQFHIIHFDQRGAGRSTPYLKVENNNTMTLLDDIAFIQKHLKLNKIMILAGSFSTLFALLYAEKYPHHVEALLLTGTFTGHFEDIEWFYEGGASRIFPDHFDTFANALPKIKADSLIEKYAIALTDENEIARMAAAKKWCAWKHQTANLHPVHETSLLEHPSTLAIATLELHYLTHRFFIEQPPQFKQIQEVPIWFLHGRYDMVFPLKSVFLLQQTLPHSRLLIVNETAHNLFEPTMIDAIITVSKYWHQPML